MRNEKMGEASIHYEEVVWTTLSNKWKISILLTLSKKTTRFNQLQRELPGISYKVLAATLKELDADGLVQKNVYEEAVLRVEYSLTEKGEDLMPIIDRLVDWWQKY